MVNHKRWSTKRICFRITAFFFVYITDFPRVLYPDIFKLLTDKTCSLLNSVIDDVNVSPSKLNDYVIKINPLSANPTKWSNTPKQFVGKKISH